MDKKRFYTVSETAKLTGYTRQYILKLIKDGTFEAHQLKKKGKGVGRHGGRWFIPAIEIPAYLRKP